MLRVDDNTRDSIEVYTIIQDDMVWNLTGLVNPEPIESSRDDCRSFFQASFAGQC
jgi:hypothetical protein